MRAAGTRIIKPQMRTLQPTVPTDVRSQEPFFPGLSSDDIPLATSGDEHPPAAAPANPIISHNDGKENEGLSSSSAPSSLSSRSKSFVIDRIIGHKAVILGRSKISKMDFEFEVAWANSRLPSEFINIRSLQNAFESIQSYIDHLELDRAEQLVSSLAQNGWTTFVPRKSYSPNMTQSMPSVYTVEVGSEGVGSPQNTDSSFSSRRARPHPPPSISFLPPVGIINVGVSCWLSAALAVFKSISCVRSVMPSSSSFAPGSLLSHVSEVFSAPTNRQAISALEASYFDSFNRRDLIGTMHDGAECFGKLVNSLSEFTPRIFESLHHDAISSIQRPCGHNSADRFFPSIIELSGWNSGFSAQQELLAWLTSQHMISSRCHSPDCLVNSGSVSYTIDRWAPTICLSFPRDISPNQKVLVRSPTLAIGGANYRQTAELLFDQERQHWFAIIEQGGKLWIMDDGSSRLFNRQDDASLKTAAKVRLVIFVKSDERSLFPILDDYQLPPPAEMPSSSSEVRKISFNLGFVAGVLHKLGTVEQYLEIQAGELTDFTKDVLAASSFEELRIAADSVFEADLSLLQLKANYAGFLIFRDEFLSLRRKDFILYIPDSVLPIVARSFSFILSGVQVALNEKDSEALDIAIALVQSFSAVLWRHERIQMTDLEFAKSIVLRCVSICTDRVQDFVAALLQDVRREASLQDVNSSRAPPSVSHSDSEDQQSPFLANRVELLIKAGDIATAADFITSRVGGGKSFLPLTEEVKNILTAKYVPDKAGPGALSRQDFLRKLDALGAKPFAPSDRDTEAIFTSSMNFKKYKAPGPSGLSNLHLARMVAVPESRSALISGLRAVFTAVHSPLLSDLSALWLYRGNGSALAHKTGIVAKLKPISIIDSLTRLAQKFVGSKLSKHRLVAPVLDGIQNVMLRDGTTMGPALMTAAISNESLKAQPNVNMALVSCDIKAFYTSFNRTIAAESLLKVANASAKPATFHSLLFEYANHLLDTTTQYAPDFSLVNHNGVIIGGASSTIYSTLAAAPFLRSAVESTSSLIHFYAYADNNSGLLSDYKDAKPFVDAINSHLRPLGLDCPPSSFHLHFPFLSPSNELREQILQDFSDFAISFASSGIPCFSGFMANSVFSSDLSGIICEGIPIGSDSFVTSKLTNAFDRAKVAITKIADFPDLPLASKFKLITMSPLATLNFLLSAVDPKLSEPLLRPFHSFLHNILRTLLRANPTDNQFLQFCLPIKDFGGFGFRSPLHYALPAFISLQLKLAARHNILHPSLVAAVSTFNKRVDDDNHISIADAASIAMTAKTSQKDLTRRIFDCLRSKLLKNISPDDQLRIHQAGLSSAGLWISPSYEDFLSESPTDSRQVLSDDFYRHCIALRLITDNMCPVLDLASTSDQQIIFQEGIRCGNVMANGQACNSVLDRAFVHACSCCRLNKYILHNITTDAIGVVASKAGISTSKSNLQVAKTTKRVDIALTGTRPNILVDVSVRSPYVKGASPTTHVDNMGRHSFDLFNHLNRAQREKKTKYASLAAADKKSFYSFIMSAAGHFSSEADTICGILADGIIKRHFLARSEVVKSLKRFVQTHMLARIAAQVDVAVNSFHAAQFQL